MPPEGAQLEACLPIAPFLSEKVGGGRRSAGEERRQEEEQNC
jgi:hypothetical protein